MTSPSNDAICSPVGNVTIVLLFGSSGSEHSVEGGDGGVTVPVPMPPDLELLVGRLKTDESRGWFVRFGQRALQTCAPCTSAGAILAYVHTAAVLLLLTSSANGRDKWRGMFRRISMLAEGYVLASVSAAPLPKDGIRVFMVVFLASNQRQYRLISWYEQWHDNIQLTRKALFLLSLLTQFLRAALKMGLVSLLGSCFDALYCCMGAFVRFMVSVG
ncbi:hypothetical protein EDB19DRAFT_1840028 [Suillus lakei]|nr:hypothetical protein EDB19DRAFT_1840028 [Suillus lakei]